MRILLSFFLFAALLLFPARSPATELFTVQRERLIQLEKNYGLWQGYVQGIGRVELRLHIFQDGQHLSRSMGYVTLSPQDPAIKFNYKTVLPEVPNWSWKITASPA